MRHRNPYRGFTLIEVLVVVGIVLVLLIGAAVFFAGRAVGGGLTAARHSARELKCSTQVRATIQSMVTWANNNRGPYPLPSGIDTKNETVADVGAAKDHSANIFSLLIYNGFISSEILICPNEVNPNIQNDADYQLTNPRAAVNPPQAYWDPAFNADFTDPNRKGNLSYAHAMPAGPRLAEWKGTFNPNYALMGDRGPQIASVAARADGGLDHTLATPSSNTLRLHGAPTSWAGNIGYNDGRVNFETSLTPPWTGPTAITYMDKAGAKRPDTFFYDEPDDAAGTNIFLALFKSAGPNAADFESIWD